MTAGSIPWLLRHELRLSLRAAKRPWFLLVVLGVALLAMHGFAYALSRAGVIFGAKMGSKFSLNPVLPVLGGFLWLTFGMTVMNAIGRTLNALFVRNDLDLLFASPISPHRVLAVRAFAIVAVGLVPLAILVLPFANVLAVLVSARFLSLYLLVLCVALAATLVAMPLCVALVRTIGVRRAQTLGQVIGILFGVTAAFGAQLGFGPRSFWREAGEHQFYVNGGAPRLLRWGGEVVLAGPLEILLGTVLCGLLLVLLARWFGQSFATIAATTTARASRTGRATVRGSIRFATTSLPGLFLRKEWRLILRNPPLLLGVVSAPLVQAIPLALLAFRNQIGDEVRISALWVFLVYVFGQVAGGLAWLAQSGEDAPDLLQMAPLDPHAILRAKAIAALAPLLVPIAACSIAVMLTEFDYGLSLFACAVASMLSCALLNVWYVAPGDRKKFAQRRKGHWGIGIAEVILSLLWSWAAWKAIEHHAWTAALAVLLALGLLALLRKRK